jgi:hypothetical protein
MDGSGRGVSEVDLSHRFESRPTHDGSFVLPLIGCPVPVYGMLLLGSYRMKGGTAKQLLGLTRLCVAVSHTHHPLVHPVTGGTRRLTLPSPSQQSTGTTSSLSSFCPTRSSLSILSLSTHHERGPARGVLIDVPAGPDDATPSDVRDRLDPLPRPIRQARRVGWRSTQARPASTGETRRVQRMCTRQCKVRDRLR